MCTLWLQSWQRTQIESHQQPHTLPIPPWPLQCVVPSMMYKQADLHMVQHTAMSYLQADADTGHVLLLLLLLLLPQLLLQMMECARCCRSVLLPASTSNNSSNSNTAD